MYSKSIWHYSTAEKALIHYYTVLKAATIKLFHLFLEAILKEYLFKKDGLEDSKGLVSGEKKRNSTFFLAVHLNSSKNERAPLREEAESICR